MSLSDKIKNAKEATWLTDGLSESEVKTTVELAKISAMIERRRIDMGLTQQEFAKYMGVTQGMVSKWESREYNFTIKSLNNICDRIGLEFRPVVDYCFKTPEFKRIEVENIESTDIRSLKEWLRRINSKKNGEIA